MEVEVPAEIRALSRRVFYVHVEKGCLYSEEIIF